MAKVLVNESSLTGIANAIRGKNGETTTYKPSEMAAAITAIPSGGGDLPEEALTISGNCSYRFANGGWDWFIENYGSQVTTSDITNVDYMFNKSKVTNIPFEINFTNGITHNPLREMFSWCTALTNIPKINNSTPDDLSGIFTQCNCLRYLPDGITNWFDWSYLESLTSAFSGSQSNMFQACFSLRQIPVDFLSHGNPNIYTSYACFNSMCPSCFALDELTNLPIPYTATWTNNTFINFVTRCYRLKNLTFAMPNGQPYVMNWKSQTIDLNLGVGHVEGIGYESNLLKYNSGITADKMVKDDTTYQALKDDPDWFAYIPAYSRYNHDSAVATINSLPDTSAYLASAGGTNTIKFKGEAGSSTDGGAISSLTQEEIAVATSRGWTVALV